MTDIFGAGAKPRLVVEAIVIKACPHCNAPGVDENQIPYGDICPKCGGKRNPDEDKGVIYDTRWHTPLGRFKRKFQSYLEKINGIVS